MPQNKNVPNSGKISLVNDIKEARKIDGSNFTDSNIYSDLRNGSVLNQFDSFWAGNSTNVNQINNFESWRNYPLVRYFECDTVIERGNQKFPEQVNFDIGEGVNKIFIIKLSPFTIPDKLLVFDRSSENFATQSIVLDTGYVSTISFTLNGVNSFNNTNSNVIPGGVNLVTFYNRPFIIYSVGNIYNGSEKLISTYVGNKISSDTNYLHNIYAPATNTAWELTVNCPIDYPDIWFIFFDLISFDNDSISLRELSGRIIFWNSIIGTSFTAPFDMSIDIETICYVNNSSNNITLSTDILVNSTQQTSFNSTITSTNGYNRKNGTLNISEGDIVTYQLTAVSSNFQTSQRYSSGVNFYYFRRNPLSGTGPYILNHNRDFLEYYNNKPNLTTANNCTIEILILNINASVVIDGTTYSSSTTITKNNNTSRTVSITSNDDIKILVTSPTQRSIIVDMPSTKSFNFTLYTTASSTYIIKIGGAGTSTTTTSTTTAEPTTTTSTTTLEPTTTTTSTTTLQEVRA